MLNQNINLNIVGGAAPYSYRFYSDSSCVNFSQPTGQLINPGLLTNIAFFQTTACLGTASLFVDITDSNGCLQTLEIPVQGICDNFVVNPISQLEDFAFSVSASSPGCSNLEFEWSYNDVVFEEVLQQDSNSASVIYLRVKEGARFLPSSSSVSVTVTDCSNCVQTISRTFQVCSPSLDNLQANLSCIFSVSDNLLFYSSQKFEIAAPSNCTSLIDWSTLEFQTPTGIAVIHDPLDPPNIIRILAQNDVIPGAYLIYYNVENQQGISSNNSGVILVNVPICGNVNTIFLSNTMVTLDCINNPGGYHEVVLEDFISLAGNAVIDWDTFQVLDSALTWQSATIDTAFPLDHITYTFNSQGQRVLRIPVDTDALNPPLTGSIVWTLCDTDGNCAEAAVISIVECTSQPVATADEACSICGASVTIFPLANDVSNAPFILSSIEIVTFPTNGTVIVNPNGSITYTPSSFFVGDDVFTYTVEDVLGNVSDPGTITGKIVCAGGDMIVNICS